ncbi:unnamed protein product [Sphagnum tenellum]
MRKLTLCALAFAALVTPAFAQIKLNTNTNDPATNATPSEWENLIGNIINADALVGEDGVLVVSSLSVPITLVTCDRWTLVGTDVYKTVRGNPATLKPFSVTYIKTKDFADECKDGVVGHYGLNKTIVGKLDSTDGTFKNSKVIVFSGPPK